MVSKTMALAACVCGLLGVGASPAFAAGDTVTCPVIAGTATVNSASNTFSFNGPGVCQFADDDGDNLVYQVMVTMNGTWNCTTSAGTMRITGMVDDHNPITATADYTLVFSGATGALTLTNTRDNDPDATVPGSGNGTFVAMPPPPCVGTFAMVGELSASWDQN